MLFSDLNDLDKSDTSVSNFTFIIMQLHNCVRLWCAVVNNTPPSCSLLTFVSTNKVDRCN